jgi:hypothetical protein
MKSKVLAALFVVSTFTCFAQDVKTSKEFNVEVGNPYAVIDAPIKEYFYHDGEVLAIKIARDITFQKFNANSLDFLSLSIVPKKKELPRGFVHEEFIQQKERIFEFYNVWDKPNKTEQIFVQEISFENPRISNNRLLKKVDGKLMSSMGQNKIDVYQSFDQSRYLMVYRRRPTEKKDKLSHDRIGFIVFDKEFEEIWQQEVTMPYTEAEMDNLGYTIDSKGNAIMLARVRTNDEARLELLKFSDDSKEADITQIEADGKYFPHGILLKEGANGNILLGGFYGNGSSATGIYVSILNQDGVIKDEQFHDIPLDIINQNKSERTQQKNAKKEDKGREIGIYELDLDDIVINDDGSMLLLGEVYYMRVTTSYNASTKSTTTTYHYYYLEMFTSKISVSGEMLWMNKLVKNQYRRSSGGGYGIRIGAAAYNTRANNYDLSYKFLTTGSEHYLLYLDNVKNLGLAQNEYPKRHVSGAGGFLTAYKVNDESGEVSKLSLFDMRDVNGIAVYQFNTDRIIQTSEDEMLVELYKKKKEDILIRININE